MIAVLGGGVSGLAAAHYLNCLGLSTKILVIEASNRLGGWINSLKHEDVFTKNPPFSKPLAISALSDFSAKKVINTDESLFSFVNRRFGLEVAKYAIDPLTRGVFAGNARDLSVTSLARRMHDVEQQYGSILIGLLKDRKNAEKADPVLSKSKLVKQAKKEKWAVWSLKGGLESFVEVLEEKLMQEGVEFRRNTPVLGIKRSGSNLVIQTDKEELEVEKAISCLPSNTLSPVIRSISPELSRLLGSIPYVTVCVVNLEYPGHLLNEPAFGYLVPSSQPNKVLGVIFDTCTFPQGDKTILTVMMGGYWFKTLFGDNPSDESLLDVAINEVKETLKISIKPVRHKISILTDCIPQYVVGHSEIVFNSRKLVKDLKLPLTLAGNSYDGVGVNDAIMSAKRAVL
ncbi:Protoporphyrinogen oxidase-like 1, partial [Homarus americanus]